MCLPSDGHWACSHFLDDGECVGYFFHEQILHVGSPGLFNRLLHSLVDFVHEVILGFDALNDPFVHFVHQCIVVGTLLKQPFLDFVFDEVLLLVHVRLVVADVMVKEIGDALDLLQFHFLPFLYVMGHNYDRSRGGDSLCICPLGR